MITKQRIDSLDTAVLTCPSCTKKKVIQVSRHEFTKLETPVRYHCPCGFSFLTLLVKKSLKRHTLNLLGTWAGIDPPKATGRLMVREVNSLGLIFSLNGKPSFEVGDRLLVEFVLDDGKQSIVRKSVRVKAMGGTFASAVFCSTDHFDNLGPYLFFRGLNTLEPT